MNQIDADMKMVIYQEYSSLLVRACLSSFPFACLIYDVANSSVKLSNEIETKFFLNELSNSIKELKIEIESLKTNNAYHVVCGKNISRIRPYDNDLDLHMLAQVSAYVATLKLANPFDQKIYNAIEELDAYTLRALMLIKHLCYEEEKLKQNDSVITSNQENFNSHSRISVVFGKFTSMIFSGDVNFDLTSKLESLGLICKVSNYITEQSEYFKNFPRTTKIGDIVCELLEKDRSDIVEQFEKNAGITIASLISTMKIDSTRQKITF